MPCTRLSGARTRATTHHRRSTADLLQLAQAMFLAPMATGSRGEQ